MQNYADRITSEVQRTYDLWYQKTDDKQEAIVRAFLSSGIELKCEVIRSSPDELLLIGGITNDQKKMVAIVNARSVHFTVTMEPKSKNSIGFRTVRDNDEMTFEAIKDSGV